MHALDDSCLLALDLTFSGKRRYQPTYADSAPSAARSPYAFCTNTWKCAWRLCSCA